MKQDEFSIARPTLKRWCNRNPTVEPRWSRQRQNIKPQPTLGLMGSDIRKQNSANASAMRREGCCIFQKTQSNRVCYFLTCRFTVFPHDIPFRSFSLVFRQEPSLSLKSDPQTAHAINEGSKAVNHDWVDHQACGLSHNNRVVSGYNRFFITNYYFSKLIRKKNYFVQQFLCPQLRKGEGGAYWFGPVRLSARYSWIRSRTFRDSILKLYV